MNRIGSFLMATALVLGSLGSVAVVGASGEHGAAAPGASGNTWSELLRRLGTAQGADRDAINAEILRFEILAAREYTARQRLLPFKDGGNLPSFGGGR